MRDVDRLVLLGDVLELRERPWREVLDAATPALSGPRRGAARVTASIVLTVGNHDHGLLAPRAAAACGRRAAAGAAGAEAEVGALGRASRWSASARRSGAERVRVCYPGVWLRDDVYATHGHYLDRHTTVPTLERLGDRRGRPDGRANRRRAGRRGGL